MEFLSNQSKILTKDGIPFRARRQFPRVKWFYDDEMPIYGIGDNTIRPYNCWCPHNLQYDKVRNRFIFVQCHNQAHAGNVKSPATMHILYPNDVLKRTDITIPSVIGIANLLILDDGTYLLYPKTVEAIRYVSTDGGESWATEQLNGSLQHAFGIYYCNGEYYAGCDYEWAEYHYSEDGINWQTKSIGADESDYVMRTKEHSFCYWDGHVYAFGRRDWYDWSDGTPHLIEDRNDCSIVYRLDGDKWTVIDDSSLLAFQSNCSPVAFDGGIAIAHIDRTSEPTLYYSKYDGDSFTTIQSFENLAKKNSQGAMTTPSLAFGNGYACIAFSIMPVIVPLSDNAYSTCINTMVVGTYEGKTFKQYFTNDSAEFNVAKLFYEDPDDFVVYPAGAKANVTWRWNTGNFDNIVNNNEYPVYYYLSSLPFAYKRVLSNVRMYPVYNGKFVDTQLIDGASNAITHNWIFDYDGRHFAVGGAGEDYGAIGSNYAIQHRFVVECDLVESSTQPTADLSAIPNGTIVTTIPANGGESPVSKGTLSYLTLLE